jgi:hypothetical protein
VDCGFSRHFEAACLQGWTRGHYNGLLASDDAVVLLIFDRNIVIVVCIGGSVHVLWR